MKTRIGIFGDAAFEMAPSRGQLLLFGPFLEEHPNTLSIQNERDWIVVKPGKISKFVKAAAVL